MSHYKKAEDKGLMSSDKQEQSETISDQDRPQEFDVFGTALNEI
ncbi:hypothetical protein [Bacillus sp. JJ1764]